MRYLIICDDCKTITGETDSLRVSAEGGRCQDCKSQVAKDMARIQRKIDRS